MDTHRGDTAAVERFVGFAWEWIAALQLADFAVTLSSELELGRNGNGRTPPRRSAFRLMPDYARPSPQRSLRGANASPRTLMAPKNLSAHSDVQGDQASYPVLS